MKKTRRPPMLWMKLPGGRAFASSRCLNSARISSDCAFAQGVTTSESAPTRTAIGMMKRSVGSIQERSERPPEEYQTTISLSCHQRIIVISTTTKPVSEMRGARFPST